MSARLASGGCILAALALLIGTAAAADRPHADAATPDECTCRGSDGRAYLLGERTCLRTASGPRLAECAMVLNNTSWRLSERACPDS